MTRLRSGLATTLPLLFGFLSLGCPHKPLLADKTRPDQPTAADARGSQSVYVIEAKGQPLIVDWQPEQRGDLEVAMREGIAVVGFDQRGLRLLTDCHLDGKYDFIGVNTKEQVVRLVSAEEVKANLPADALGIIAKLEGSLGQSQALDIAIVMVGKKRTTWSTASKKDLKGKCDGATHFVRGATIGAFAMRSGAKGKARTVAEIFGAGASAAASSEKSVANADGLLDSCRKASPDSESPPPQCGALIRLELLKLDEKGGTPKQEQKATVATASDTEACPPGFVFAEGKCTKPEAVAFHACKTGDVRDCTIQCEKGSAESCNTLGGMFWAGNGVSANRKESAQLFQKSCAQGFASGCYNYGLALYNGDGVSANQSGAMPYFLKGCQDGVAAGCSAAGRQFFFAQGAPKDDPKAAKLLFLGCKGGDQFACSDLGVMVMGNIGGLKRDDRLAASLFKKACDGNVTMGCSNFGYVVEFGKGVPKDEKRASEIYARSCQADAAECIWLAISHHSGIGVKRDAALAKKEFQQSCDVAKVRPGGAAEAVACIVSNELFGAKNPVDFKAVKDGAQSWKETCKSGAERDCSLMGVAALGIGERDTAKQVLGLACKLGDRWACDLMKHPKVK